MCSYKAKSIKAIPLLTPIASRTIRQANGGGSILDLSTIKSKKWSSETPDGTFLINKVCFIIAGLSDIPLPISMMSLAANAVLLLPV